MATKSWEHICWVPPTVSKSLLLCIPLFFIYFVVACLLIFLSCLELFFSGCDVKCPSPIELLLFSMLNRYLWYFAQYAAKLGWLVPYTSNQFATYCYHCCGGVVVVVCIYIYLLPCSWLQNNLFCSHFELR